MLQARTQFTDIFTAKRTSPAYECTCAHAKTLSTAYLPCWHATSSVCCNAQPNPYKQIRPCRYLASRFSRVVQANIKFRVEASPSALPIGALQALAGLLEGR